MTHKKSVQLMAKYIRRETGLPLPLAKKVAKAYDRGLSCTVPSVLASLGCSKVCVSNSGTANPDYEMPCSDVEFAYKGRMFELPGYGGGYMLPICVYQQL